jgi:D-alanyl-D-alanine carboxypeptidase
MRRTAARTKTRRTLTPTAIFLVVLTAAIIGILDYQSAPSSAPSFIRVRRGDNSDTTASAPSFTQGIPGDHGGTTTEDDGAVTEDDGVLPDGVTVFDDRYPGVASLDPVLLQALREAATDAADDGIEFSISSGWRSPEYQDQLLREAVSRYGSEEEAARWVASADTSAHVSGDAVDIEHFDAMAWLSEHGAEDGLCQIYRNEPWHYELRPQAIDRGCPPMYTDPTHDPRMRR